MKNAICKYLLIPVLLLLPFVAKGVETFIESLRVELTPDDYQIFVVRDKKSKEAVVNWIGDTIISNKSGLVSNIFYDPVYGTHFTHFSGAYNLAGIEICSGELPSIKSVGRNRFYFSSMAHRMHFKHYSVYDACNNRINDTTYRKPLLYDTYREEFYEKGASKNYLGFGLPELNYDSLISINRQAGNENFNKRHSSLCGRTGGVDWRLVESGNYVGIVGDNGESIIPFSRKYSRISYFDMGMGLSYFFVRSDQGLGVCDSLGREIIAPNLSSIEFKRELILKLEEAPAEFEIAYIKTCANKKYGICGQDGRVIVPPYYDEISYCNGGYFSAEANERISAFEPSGTQIQIGTPYYSVLEYSSDRGFRSRDKYDDSSFPHYYYYGIKLDENHHAVTFDAQQLREDEQRRKVEEVSQGWIGDIRYIGLNGTDNRFPLHLMFDLKPWAMADQCFLWDTVKTEENAGLLDFIFPGLRSFADIKGCYLNGEKVMELLFAGDELLQIVIYSPKVLLISNRGNLCIPFTEEEIQSYKGYDKTCKINLMLNRIYITQRH